MFSPHGIHFDAGCAILLGVAVSLCVAGCSGSPSQGGEILIGRPEVFTRARLVNRRLSEQQWLEAKLDATPSTENFQGFQDVRTFAGLYNKTSASFDPLAGKLAVAQNNLNVQTLQNQIEANTLQQQIDILKLRQQLSALQNGSNQTGNSSTSSNISGSGPPSTSGSPNTGSSPPGETPPSPTGVFNNAPGVPNPNEIVATQAKLTSIEFLRDQLAYRNAVQAALREQELDDTHDLDGLTLYTLKFDVSVVPHGTKNDGYAKVELKFSPSNTDSPICETIQKAYRSWVWHVRSAIHMEAVALEQRLELGLLSQEETVRLAAHTGTLQRDTSSDTAYNASAAFFKAAKEKPSNLSSDAKHGAVQLVQEKYSNTLTSLISFHDPPLKIGVGDQATGYYVPNISAKEDIGCPASLKDGTLGNFYKAINPGHATVFVADPKEEAQNISDVAAIEQLHNIVLSLQALIPQYGVNASNYTEYMRRSQERLHGILRRPLVVAYSSGEKFGWIFGPRFEIGSDAKPTFNHTMAQRSVQVSIVVAGWTRNLDIDYRTFWVDGNGNSRLVDGGTFPVTLPGDDAAITAKLLAASGERRIPFIEPPTTAANELQLMHVQAGQPVDILIRGRNLWRNPKVFIGAQPANTVNVLPDMNGLSAHFNKVAIAMRPTQSQANLRLDLSVATSEGIAVLPKVIEIFSDTSVPAQKPSTPSVLKGVVATIITIDAKTGKAALKTEMEEVFTLPKERGWKVGDKVKCNRINAEPQPELQNCKV